MRGLFRFPDAVRFIAILGLVGLGADRAMAQSAPQLLFAKLGSTGMVPESVPAPTSLESSGHALANRSAETRLPSGDFSAISNVPTSNPIALRSAPNISLPTEIMKSNAIGPVRRARSDVFSTFILAYNSLSKSLAVRAKSLIQKYAALTPAAVVGVASTYNPYLDGIGSDDKQTGSLMTQLHGPPRFGSICGRSLVVSAMAKIIDPPLRWSRAAKSVSSSKSTMLVHLEAA